MKRKLGFIFVIMLALCLSFGLASCDKTLESLRAEDGITVSGGGFTKGCSLVADIKTGSDIDADLQAKIGKIFYNSDYEVISAEIFVAKDGKEVKPEGEMSITVPVPSNYPEIVLYKLSNSGELVQINSEQNSTGVVFTSTELGTFVIAVKDIQMYTIGLEAECLIPGSNSSLSGVVDVDIEGVSEEIADNIDYLLNSTNQTRFQYTAGTKLNMSATPVSDSFVFVGWYQSDTNVTALNYTLISEQQSIVYTVPQRDVRLLVKLQLKDRVSAWDFTVNAYGGNEDTCYVNAYSLNDRLTDGRRSMFSLYEGQRIELKANTGSGYKFVGWFEEDLEVATTLQFKEPALSTEKDYTFIMGGDSACSVYAVYEYDVKSIKVDGTNVGFNSEGAAIYQIGDNEKPNFESASVYAVLSDDSEALLYSNEYSIDYDGLNYNAVGTYTVKYIYNKDNTLFGSLTIKAVAKKYTVTFSVGLGNGLYEYSGLAEIAIQGESDSLMREMNNLLTKYNATYNSYEEGKALNITANALTEAFVFEGWYLSEYSYINDNSTLLSTEETVAYTVRGNANLIMKFSKNEGVMPNTFFIDAMGDGDNNRVECATQNRPETFNNRRSYSLYEGQKMLIEAFSMDGYNFVGWYEMTWDTGTEVLSEEAVSTDDKYLFTMPAYGCAMIAVFEYDVDYLLYEGVVPDPQRGPFMSYTIGVSAKPQFYNCGISAVLTNGEIVELSYQLGRFTYDADNIDYEVPGNYDVTFTYTKDTTKSVTVVFVVSANDCYLKAWVENPYGSNEGGTLIYNGTDIGVDYQTDLDGEGKGLAYGETDSITAQVTQEGETLGYVFKGWYNVDKTELLSSDATYTFTAKGYDQSVVAVFGEPNKYMFIACADSDTGRANGGNIQYSAVGGTYSGSLYENVGMLENDEVQITAVEDNYFTFTGWYKYGEEGELVLIQSGATYNYTCKATDESVYAMFALNVTDFSIDVGNSGFDPNTYYAEFMQYGCTVDFDILKVIGTNSNLEDVECEVSSDNYNIFYFKDYDYDTALTELDKNAVGFYTMRFVSKTDDSIYAELTFDIKVSSEIRLQVKLSEEDCSTRDNILSSVEARQTSMSVLASANGEGYDFYDTFISDKYTDNISSLILFVNAFPSVITYENEIPVSISLIFVFAEGFDLYVIGEESEGSATVTKAETALNQGIKTTINTEWALTYDSSCESYRVRLLLASKDITNVSYSALSKAFDRVNYFGGIALNIRVDFSDFAFRNLTDESYLFENALDVSSATLANTSSNGNIGSYSGKTIYYLGSYSIESLRINQSFNNYFVRLWAVPFSDITISAIDGDENSEITLESGIYTMNFVIGSAYRDEMNQTFRMFVYFKVTSGKESKTCVVGFDLSYEADMDLIGRISDSLVESGNLN